MNIEIYKNLFGEDCVTWIDENGGQHSMYKWAFDAMKQEAK